MKQDKFKIVNLIKELIVRIDETFINFPKREIELKNRIKNTAFDMLYNAYRGNVTEDKCIKIEIADNLVTEIKLLDFLINLCLDKQIITHKKYVKFGESLDIIARYIVNWKKSFNT